MSTPLGGYSAPNPGFAHLQSATHYGSTANPFGLSSNNRSSNNNRPATYTNPVYGWEREKCPPKNHPSGATYKGGRLFGWPNGKGIYHYADGDVYDGFWVLGMKQGKGTLRYRDGGYYQGSWKAGKKHGKGTERSADGSSYQGGWRDGHEHGQHCTKINKEGHIWYEGAMRNGNFHGKALYRLPDGTCMLGGFVQNDYFEPADRSRYSGKSLNGYAHDPYGIGTMRYPDGGQYQGQWLQGKKHGRGTYTYPDGSTYAGLWKKGRKHDGPFVESEGGLEIHNYPSQTVRITESMWYDGPVDQDGEPHGTGMATTGGGRYEGNWESGVFEGVGRIEYPDGNVYEGMFHNGKQQGWGKYFFTDGDHYEGTFVNGLKGGDGTLFYANGNSEPARFVDSRCMALSLLQTESGGS